MPIAWPVVRLTCGTFATLPTGAAADHRLAMKASRIGIFARAIASALKVPGAPDAIGVSEGEHKWAAAVARDLQKPEHAGRAIVLAGPTQPAEAHALVHAINHALGNHGKTITFT